MKPDPVRPTHEQFTAAVLALAELIPFFPQTEVGQTMIISALESFVATDEQLAWLTMNAANHMRKWSGLADLRGMFCTRWKPLDGREEHCDVPGFTASDCEADYYRRMGEENARLLEKWKTEKLLAPPGEIQEFPPLPRLKLLPRPEPAPYKPPADSRPLKEIEREVIASIRPQRSPEETARLARDLEQQVEARRRNA